jgi:hypothetical protein
LRQLQRPIPDFPEAFQLGDPSMYLMFRAAEAEFVVHGERTRKLLEHGLEDVPHVAALPELSMQYLFPFRLPARASDPLCRNMMQCRFKTFDASERGYVGRRFHIYGREDATQFCLDCLLERWSMQAHLNARNPPAVMHPLNTFTVICGRGEYANSKNVVYEATVEARLKGIFGHVPVYARRLREFVALPKHVAVEHGLDPAHARFYLAEVNVDFRQASAGATRA